VQIIQTKNDLASFKDEVQKSIEQVGFVPTMGALHQGHISLLKQCQAECSISVVSIFVNPLQFNNKDDFEKYPSTIEEDIALLKENECDYLFLPDVSLIYPENYEPLSLSIEPLNHQMEGEFRPGHFEGVIKVVHRLFSLIQPQKAYFGTKDFQQLVIISHMVKSLSLPIEIVPCETVREVNGLAMSSRNTRLSSVQKKEATFIYEVLCKGKSLASSHSPQETKNQLIALFKDSPLKLEYLEIVDSETLTPLDRIWLPQSRVCIAAYCGDIRLIDNLQLTE
jgi:pantoate--beta-alanine ligase